MFMIQKRILKSLRPPLNHKTSSARPRSEYLTRTDLLKVLVYEYIYYLIEVVTKTLRYLNMTEVRVDIPTTDSQVLLRKDKRLQTWGATERYSSSRSGNKIDSSADNRNMARERDTGNVNPAV